MTTPLSRSRVWRKLLQHRPALISLFVILAYVGAGAAVLCGWVTVEHTDAAYAAPQIPGFGLLPEPDERIEDVAWYLNRIRIPLSSLDPVEAFQNFPIEGLAPADLSVAELRARLAAADRQLIELRHFPDINTLVASGGSDGQQAIIQLQTLEQDSAALFTLAPGVSPAVRRIHLSLGTDRLGRSILLRAVYSIRVAILVGLVTGLLSVATGATLGLVAGYFGGWVDVAVSWLYSTFASIPNIVLLILMVYIFREGTIDEKINNATGDLLKRLLGGVRLDETLVPVYVAFCATFWIGPCRVIRGEALKLRELEYIQAARVLGYGRHRILLRHLLPNVSHLILINFSLLFIGAIKSEVILSFLGLGVQEGASWGLMISFAKDEVVNGFFWQIGVATVFMFGLVLAFNILSDGLQDILDPKHV
ncbi:MAG: ABC transporter permease [Fuerstiella sp.]|nr:ABC transporter permease [Fuerstiella sp.]